MTSLEYIHPESWSPGLQLESKPVNLIPDLSPSFKTIKQGFNRINFDKINDIKMNSISSTNNSFFT